MTLFATLLRVLADAQVRFIIVGGANTFNVALAVPPEPDSAVETAPVVLALAPSVVPLTLTLMLHVAGLTASEPPVRLMLVAAATGVNVPPHVFVAVGVASTSTPAGNASLIAKLVNATVAFGLPKVIVNVDVPPTGMLVGTNALVTVGGATTFRFADAVFPVPPFVDVTARVVLVY